MAGRVSIIGAGSWGTALAKMLADSGHDVTVWAHNADVVRAITDTRENSTYLPGFALPPTLTPIMPTVTRLMNSRELYPSRVKIAVASV